MRTTYLPHIPQASLGSELTLAKVLLIAIGLVLIATVITVTYTGTPTLGPVKVTGETGARAGIGAGVEAVVRWDHR